MKYLKCQELLEARDRLDCQYPCLFLFDEFLRFDTPIKLFNYARNLKRSEAKMIYLWGGVVGQNIGKLP